MKTFVNTNSRTSVKHPISLISTSHISVPFISSSKPGFIGSGKPSFSSGMIS
jgi:hypothetical protein